MMGTDPFLWIGIGIAYPFPDPDPLLLTRSRSDLRTMIAILPITGYTLNLMNISLNIH